MKPFARFHQYRTDQATRDRHATVRLAPADLIVPLFVVPGTDIRRPIPSLDGVCHLSIDQAVQEARRIHGRGFGAVLLFGVPDPADRSPLAPGATDPDGLVPRAIRAIRQAVPGLTVMTDVCICAWTDHGHCGLLQPGQPGTQPGIDNDATLPVLAAMAASHALAGAQWVAPSAMMDGQVAAIRQALDAQGCHSTRILGYSTKFASAFYGPFRDAAASAPACGDRQAYQMDCRAPDQASGEAQADLDEGAAAIMVKPAIHYLDIICRLRQQFPAATLAAYHVSGEYMMLRAAADRGLVDEARGFREALMAIKRAGADWIITYAADRVFP